MTDREILLAVRRLINSPERWTRGKSAETESGERVAVNHPEAYRFCLGGAFDRVLIEHHAFHDRRRVGRLTKLLDDAVPGATVEYVSYNDNDYTQHQDILALLDRAIDAVPA